MTRQIEDEYNNNFNNIIYNTNMIYEYNMNNKLLN